MRKENQALVEAASTLARTLACSGILLSADVIEDGAALKAIVGEQRVILVARDEVAVHNACQEFSTVLRIPAGATHVFEEPGTLEDVARLVSQWFLQHLHTASGERQS